MEIKWTLDVAQEGITGKPWTLAFSVPVGWQPLQEEARFDAETRVLRLPVEAPSGALVWRVDRKVTGPFVIRADLLEVAADASEAVIASAELTIGEDLVFDIGPEGGEVSAFNGKLRVTFPPEAMGQLASLGPSSTMRIHVRQPSYDRPGFYALSPYTFEITAEIPGAGPEGASAAVDSFVSPITIEVQYDDAQIRGDEGTLTIFYFDDDMGTWRPISSDVDPDVNIVRAEVDHLTTFDIDTQNLQTARIPSVADFQTALCTGSATYGLDLVVPPGPGGLQPSLTLGYSSLPVDSALARTQASWAGMGWTLDTGYVVRDSHGTSGYPGDDTFSLNVGGIAAALLPIPDADGDPNTTDFKTVDDTFWRVRQYMAYDQIYVYLDDPRYGIMIPREISYWVVWDKTGTRFTFADRASYPEFNQGECVPPGFATIRPWRWSLTSLRNPFGQELTFSYGKESKFVHVCGGNWPNFPSDLAVYPEEIRYSHQRYRVRFVRAADRMDYDPAWYDPAAQVLFQRSRITELRAEQDANGDGTFERLIRKYTFSYETNPALQIFPNSAWPAGGRTLTLASVQEWGLDGTSSLPAVSFTYGDGMHLTRAENGYGGRVEYGYELWNDVGGSMSAGQDFSAGCPLGWYPDPGEDVHCVYGMLWVDGTGNNDSLTSNFQPGGVYKVRINAGPYEDVPTMQLGLTDSVSFTAWSDPIVLSPGGWFEWTVTLPPTAARARLLIECNPHCAVHNYEFHLLSTHYRVATRRLADDLTGQSYAYAYSYSGAATNDAAHSAGAASALPYVPMYAEFRGHASVEETAPDGSIRETWFNQDDVLKGRAYRTEVSTSGGSLLAANDSTFVSTEQTAAPTPTFPHVSSGGAFTDLKIYWTRPDEDITKVYEGTGSWEGTRRQYGYDPALQGGTQYGNQTGVTSSAGDAGGWTAYRSTRTVYVPFLDGTRYLVGLPSSVEVRDSSGTSASRNLYYYDDASSAGVAPSAGVMTASRTWTDSPGGQDRYADALYDYDAWGNLLSTTAYSGYGTLAALSSSGPRTASGIYDDTYHTYPVSSQDALNHPTTRVLRLCSRSARSGNRPQRWRDLGKLRQFRPSDGSATTWRRVRPADHTH